VFVDLFGDRSVRAAARPRLHVDLEHRKQEARSPMCWGALLTVVTLACPPARVVYYSCGPEMVASPAIVTSRVIYYEIPCTVQTIPAPAPVALVETMPAAAAVVQDAVAQPAALAQPEGALEPVMAEEPIDDSTLENAAFLPPFAAGRTLDQLALGWGVSTIGNGVLYPTPLRSGGYAGGFGGFGGGGSSGDGAASAWTIIYNNLPPIIINVPQPPGGNPNNPPPGRVPEPASLLAWAVGAAGLLLVRRRMAAKTATV
jgi:hypothetical protein